MNSAKPLVSIIIPTYNDRAWVCDAIDSALAQTHGPLEIIVVDDGSTDGTSDLIHAKYGARINCIRQQNRGLSAARNSGIAAASGEYVQFLDADDLLLPTKVARHVAVLESNPACDVVYCDFAFVGSDIDGPRMPSGFLDRYREGQVFSDLLADNFIVVHAALSRLAAVRSAGGFDEGLAACEDYDLWLRLAAAGSAFLHTPSVLVLYRRREGSMSTASTRQIAATIDVVDKVSEYATLDEALCHVQRMRLATLHEMLSRALCLEGFHFLRRGRVLRAAATIVRAFRAAPAVLPRISMRARGRATDRRPSRSGVR